MRVDCASKLRLQGEPLKCVNGSHVLGARMSFARGVPNDTGKERGRRGAEIARRIQWAPLLMGTRAQLIALIVCPIPLYDVSLAGLLALLMEQLSSAVMNAVWGLRRKRSVREFVMTFFVPGHRFEPHQAMSSQSVYLLRKFLETRQACASSSMLFGIGINTMGPRLPVPLV